MKYSQPMKVTKIIVVSLNISLLKLYGIIQLTITCYNTDAIGDSENTGGKTITGNPATVFVTLINLKCKTVWTESSNQTSAIFVRALPKTRVKKVGISKGLGSRGHLYM